MLVHVSVNQSLRHRKSPSRGHTLLSYGNAPLRRINAMIPDATRLAHLAPPQRAEFAVTSRLLSCLVTESLLRALYFPLGSGANARGFALILLDDPSVPSASRTTDISQITDFFALIPLQGTPILASCEDESTIREITLLDPLDMVPLPLVVAKYDPLHSPEIDNPSALAAAIDRESVV